MSDSYSYVHLTSFESKLAVTLVRLPVCTAQRIGDVFAIVRAETVGFALSLHTRSPVEIAISLTTNYKENSTVYQFPSSSSYTIGFWRARSHSFHLNRTTHARPARGQLERALVRVRDTVRSADAPTAGQARRRAQTRRTVTIFHANVDALQSIARP